ncbi:MAG: hypothetical protein V9F06_09635 [Thermomicrobiales bacterium]
MYQCAGTSPSQSMPDGLSGTCRVEAARHRLVDDRLLLLVQQLDLAALGADEAGGFGVTWCVRKPAMVHLFGWAEGTGIVW